MIKLMASSVGENKASNRLWLWIAVACIVVSMVGSHLVQSSGGTVQIRQLKLVVKSGYEINGQIYIPKSASAKSKLPLIALQHGSQHKLQMRDMNIWKRTSPCRSTGPTLMG